jgi:uncharacterized protein
MEGIGEEDRLLLLTAALFHDLGFIQEREDHELIGAQIAARVLPDFGYSEEQVQIIVGIIMATKLPRSPANLLQEIMADADLDVLGREDFWITSLALRAELEANGSRSTDEEWYRSQLEFLKEHEYFTVSAKALREEKKQRNIQELVSIINSFSNQDPKQVIRNER